MRGWRLCCGVVLVAAMCGCGRRGAPESPQMAGPETTVGPGPTAQQEPQTPGEPGVADLRGKRVLMIVAPKDFRDEEFEQPYQILGSAGAKITVGSLRKGECVGVAGTKIQATATPGDVKVADYEMLVFVGGPGMTKYLSDPSLIKLAKDFAAARKVIGAICVAPVILARAGLLKGIEATVWPDMKQELVGRAASYVAEDVVVSGTIITASGPDAAEAFAGTLAAALATPAAHPASPDESAGR
ncbi:MAG: DJ-1/PfpI family protein [Armatimonadetes bacterium]|nr:DJ-1/PfpI family protein [Armatimonadota bacterium]